MAWGVCELEGATPCVEWDTREFDERGDYASAAVEDDLVLDWVGGEGDLGVEMPEGWEVLIYAGSFGEIFGWRCEGG